jgi:hypothetical protein
MFSCFSNHCPSSRDVPAANAVCKPTDILGKLRLNVRNLKSFSVLVFCLFYLCACVIAIVTLYSFRLRGWPLAVEFTGYINKEFNYGGLRRQDSHKYGTSCGNILNLK